MTDNGMASAGKAVAALHARANGARQWTISWNGRTYTAAALTIGMWALLEGLNGAGWDCGNPQVGPNHAANVLAVLVAAAEGRPLDEVLVDIAARPASELTTALGSAPIEV